MNKGTVLAMFSNVLSFLAGFAVAVFAEPVRQRLFRPKLSLEFKEDPRHISDTWENFEGKKNRANYIRIEVTNTSIYAARDCKAYLIDIEKQDETGKFVSTVYCDSIQLAWSCQGERDRYGGVDIHKGVRQYIDLVVTREGSNIFYPQTMVIPRRYSGLFKQIGLFRFTVQVSAAGADPIRILLLMRWNGAWNDYEVSIAN
jgi:hypothetical protein